MPFSIAPMAAAAVAGLERTEPLRITEAWFPIESAPMGMEVWVSGWTTDRIKYIAVGIQAEPGLWDIERRPGTFGIPYLTPNEWRLLPEQEA